MKISNFELKWRYYSTSKLVEIATLQKVLVQDLNLGPLAPEARIIPLDQRALN